MSTRLTLNCKPEALRGANQGALCPCLLAVPCWPLVLALTMAAGQAQVFTTIKSFGTLTNVTGMKPQSTLVQGPDGTLYGTASYGGGSVAGTLFKLQPDGSAFAVLKWFTNSIEGANPYPGLALSGSVLYGTTANGGSSSYGTVFKLNTDGTGYTVLKNFTGSDGAHPYYAGLTLSGSALYGVTYSGGSSNYGTVFKLNTDGTSYTVLKNFTGSDGANPNWDLTLSGSVLYGTTENGGSSGYGTVFKVNTDGTGFALLKNFTNSPDGAYPDGVLTLSGSVLYGTTYRGGGSYYGTVFKLNTDGSGYTILKSFDAITETDGLNPSGRLALSGGVLYGTTSSGFDNTVFQMNTDGSGYTVLHTFAGSPDGGVPYAGLTLSSNVLYGTTYYGGGSGGGTVFKLNTDGSGYTVLESFAGNFDATPFAGLTLSGSVLYGTTGTANGPSGSIFKVNTDGTGYALLRDFTGSDAADPSASLTLSGSMLYGTTSYGGSSSNGTVFKLNTDGTGYTVLHNFTGSDGGQPGYGALTLSGSVLYGTTWNGGSSNAGTVFAVGTDGTGFTNLYSFTAISAYPGPYTNSDGAHPGSGLVLSAGTLYGTSSVGGTSGNGTVFAVNIDGTGFTNLHNFMPLLTGTNSDGANPYSGLILGGSTLYGTATAGGTSGNGTVFKLNNDGTGFAVLKSFANGDGATPNADLTLVGSTLYGTTTYGGSSGNGTVFKIATNGSEFTVLKNFTGSDGANPYGKLTLSNSVLYGTTSSGGFLGAGTVFSLSFPPQLTITPSGTNVILSWPTNVAGFDYTGYTLQSSTNLLSPAAWVTNSPAPVVINGQNTVTNLISGPQWFYRLIH